MTATGIVPIATGAAHSHRLVLRAGAWRWEVLTYPACTTRVLESFPAGASLDECARAVGRAMGRCPERYPARRWMNTAASDAAYYTRLEES